MDTKQAAEKWDNKQDWVAERCREGIIPSAKQENGRGTKWDIAEHAEKPPCRGKEAKVVLENLLQLAEGKDLYLYNPKQEEHSKRILDYLSRYGYIQKLPPDGVWTAETVPKAPVCKLGLELIQKVTQLEEAKKKNKLSKKQVKNSIKFKVDTKDGIGIQYTRDTTAEF